MANHALVANNLTVGHPIIDSPVLSQPHHAFVADPLTVSHPVFSVPAVHQSHVLAAATNLTVGSPSIGSPLVADVLAADGLTVGSPEFSSPKLTRWWQPSVYPEPGEIIDHPGSRILYRAATGLEKAMADADAERLVDLNAELVNEVWNPYKISARNLPYLGWAMGVNLWESQWTEATKREWTAIQWHWKAKRGTEGAIRQALDFAGRDRDMPTYELLQVIAPPQGFFASPAMTKDEWDSWIRQMPQIRIKFASYTGDGDDEFFAEPEEYWYEPAPGETGVGGDGFCNFQFAGKDDGPALYGRKAVLRAADGTETDLRLTEWIDTTVTKPETLIGRVSTTGDAGTTGGFISDDGFVGDDTYVGFDPTAPYLVSYRIAGNYEHTVSELHLSYISPGLTPIDIAYERDSDTGTDDLFFFVRDHCNDPDHKVYVGDGAEAAEMLADRIYLHDPAVAALMLEGISFVGVDRVNVPAYHADLLVDLHTRDPSQAWYVDEGFVGEEITIAEDLTDLDRALRAVCAAKALRDKVAVSFEATQPIMFRDLATSSEDTIFGEQRRTIL